LAPMAAADEIALTRTGERRLSVVPSPSWPLSFAPQPHALPSLFKASAYAPPAEIDVTLSSPLTCTGLSRRVLVPSPSWPRLLSPHANTLPSDFSASVYGVYEPPAETLVTFPRP